MAKAQKKKKFDVDRAHRIIFVITFAVMLVSLGALSVKEYQKHKSLPAPGPVIIEDGSGEGESHE